MDATMTTIAYTLPNAKLLEVKTGLLREGYEVEYDKHGGTLIAKLDGIVIVRALQTNKTWILRAVPGLFI